MLLSTNKTENVRYEYTEISICIFEYARKWNKSRKNT